MSAPHAGSTMSGMLNATLNDLPEIIDVDGRPCWLWPDGTTRPVIRGGIDSGGGDGGQGGDSVSGDGAGSGAGGDAGGSGDGSGAGGSSGSRDAGQGGDTKKLEITQAELDEMIEKRLTKARKGWDAEITQAAERAKMDEAARAKAEKDDATAAANEATNAANRKLVVADAKVAALAAKVPADRVNAFVRLADLTEVEVDDDGTVDETALSKAVKKTLKDHPFLVADAGGKGGSSGGDMNGNGGKQKATSLEDAVAARYAG